MIPPGTLTLREVADFLHISPDSVYTPSQAGRLPGLKVGHQWFIKKRALTSHVVASLQKSERPQTSQHTPAPSQPRDHSTRR
ncbi:MAG: helix-turn-helix domain-containing protein [Candidatus Binatia bacterium]